MSNVLLPGTIFWRMQVSAYKSSNHGRPSMRCVLSQMWGEKTLISKEANVKCDAGILLCMNCVTQSFVSYNW